MRPKSIRSISPEELVELKAATRNAIRSIGQKGFAEATRVLAPALSSYGSISEAEFMPVDVLVDLERSYPDGVASPLLELLVDLAGFRLVPKGDGEDHVEFSVDDIHAMSKENGEAERATLALLTVAGRDSLAVVRAAKQELAEAKAATAESYDKAVRLERQLMQKAR